MPRLLFLIADTGGGHRASAKAVSNRLAADAPGHFEVTLLDPFAASSRAAGGGASLYGPLTRHAPWLWGALWHATNSRMAVDALTGTLLRPVEAVIRRRIADTAPDAVVSFHPLLNHAMVRSVRRCAPGTPTLTVVTDLVDVHRSWFCPGVDAVVVASEEVLERCRRAGIAPERCHPLGLPVDERFTSPPPSPEERVTLRRLLGLDEQRFTVLVCGGADGSGGLVSATRALASAPSGLQVAVITGHNRRARRQLEGLHDATGSPVSVNGFVDNMPDWLRAADVVATKAGPGTIAEALCCGVPVLITSYLPGQERGNVRWVTATGAGRYEPRPAQLVAQALELAAPGSPTLRRMQESIRRLAHRDAAERIASLIQALVRFSAPQHPLLGSVSP